MTGAGPGWDEFFATALVGTDRRARPDAMDGVGPEARLLDRVAVLTACRRAGWVPPRSPDPAPPAPDDDSPLCSPVAAQVLSLLIEGEVRIPGGPAAIIEEWLRRAAESGRRCPARLLPAVLDFGARLPDLGGLVSVATGARGRWLAQRNPDWCALAATAGAEAGAGAGTGTDELETRFATASRTERAAILGVVRRRDPDRGRELLESTWATEGAAGRASLLAALEPSLSAADEPFVESALDDRAKSVREVANRLLERLPTSRRAARMAARLRPLVAVSGTFRKKLEVEWPGEPDASARRDGATDVTVAGFGLKASWLLQLVAAAPLSFWLEVTGLAPGELVVLAKGRAELIEGWSRAAVAQRDAAWANALFQHRPSADLVAVMGPAETRASVQAALSRKGVQAPLLMDLLRAVPGPWSPEFSEAAVGRLHAAPRPLAFAAAPVFAARLDPSVAHLVEKWRDGLADDPAVGREVAAIQHALSIRQTIAEEFG